MAPIITRKWQPAKYFVTKPAGPGFPSHQQCLLLTVIADLSDSNASRFPDELPHANVGKSLRSSESMGRRPNYSTESRLRPAGKFPVFSVSSRPSAVKPAQRRSVETATPQSDHDLMLAVRDGELDALGELFERHHGPLFGFLNKLTGDHTAAEDIAQVVFQRMLKYRHTYRDEGRFATWMYHLARRCAVDHFRKSQRTPTATDPVNLHQHADDQPHAGETATTNDDHNILHHALNQLDRDDREILLLSRFQELPFAEIASILECSIGAAKVRAHRALRELRDIYLQIQKENLT
jgi:RNA polymerase sigma factor (sigma-70 family)